MAAKTGYPEPAWFGQFRQAYSSTQAYVLHGNVNDYVIPGQKLPTFLNRRFENRDLIAYYDRAHGITFATPTQEAMAKKMLAVDAPPPDPALAALGLAGGGASDELPRNPGAALPLLEKLLKSDKSVAVVLQFGEHLAAAQDSATMAPDDRTTQIILRSWGTDMVIKDRGNFVLLVVDVLTDISPSLRAASSRWKAIEVPLPDTTAREQFIKAYLDSWGIQMEMSAPELARAAAGLSLVHIEAIFLTADSVGSLSWELVRQAKADIIRGEYAGLLSIMEPTYGFEAVGGMEQLKTWARNEIMRPVREGRINDVPGGVLFVGPPGTGKSHFVRALAREVGFNAVALNLENIMSKWQGQSERDMARALGVVKSLSPVLLFMDELDQSEGASRGQNSGSPSGKNIFNQLLQFLADPANRGKVIFFGASNRPDLIDPALMRFGRIDAIVPIMLPSAAERSAVALASANSQGCPIAPTAQDIIAIGSDRYSCADVTAIVTKARKLMGRRGGDCIEPADAQAALACIRPATLKQATYFEGLALDACNDIELLPEGYRGRIANRAEAGTTPSAPVADDSAALPRRKRDL